MPRQPEVPQDFDCEFPPEPTRTRFPARAVNAAPVADLPPEKREVVPQVEVMRENPAIAPYLDGGQRWGGATLRRTGVAAGLSAVFLLLFLLLPGWDMMGGYSPPAVSEKPQPRPYGGAPSPASDHRLQAIHADIAAGNRVKAAYDKLTALLDEAEEGVIDPPADVVDWARTEILVALASGEVPPSAYEESLPDRVYAALTDSLAGEARPSFRAVAAYVRAAGRESGGPDRQKALSEALERLRSEYPGDLDGERDLLSIEAEHHIASLPADYSPGDRQLEYHWRRAAHAVGRLYSMYGTRDSEARRLDRQRWRALRRYYSLTLLTLDRSRLGWRTSVVVDGREYHKADVDRILQQLKG